MDKKLATTLNTPMLTLIPALIKSTEKAWRSCSKLSINMSFISQQKFQQIKEKLKEWETKLNETIKGKAEAAEVGGNVWHDNPAFEEIERLHDLYTAKINTIKKELREAQIINRTRQTEVKENNEQSVVSIGSKLLIKYSGGKTVSMEIAGHGESNYDQSKVAYDTPLGQSLMRKRAGDKVSFFVDDKKIEVEIIVKY